MVSFTHSEAVNDFNEPEICRRLCKFKTLDKNGLGQVKAVDKIFECKESGWLYQWKTFESTKSKTPHSPLGFGVMTFTPMNWLIALRELCPWTIFDKKIKLIKHSMADTLRCKWWLQQWYIYWYRQRQQCCPCFQYKLWCTATFDRRTKSRIFNGKQVNYYY